MTDDQDFNLVMPFVTVASKGGPHDDSSYIHGYEMGHLDAILAPGSLERHEATIHTANQPQADLIAMRNGYRMELVTASDGWVEVELIQNGETVPDDADVDPSTARHPQSGRECAAVELDAVAEDLLGFGDTAPSCEQVRLAAWLQATADNLRAGRGTTP